MRRVRPSDRALRVLVYALLACGAAVMLLPLVWMVSASLKPISEIIRVPPTWVPEQVTLSNYREVFEHFPFARYFLNSAVTTAMIIASVVVTSATGGYALSKFRLPGRNVLFGLFLLSLMIPFQVRMVPLFEMMVELKLVDSYLGVAYPFLFDAAGVFLMRQFIDDLPGDLIEAARIDGAGELQIFLRIVVPLLAPAFAALSILTFSAAWEEFLWPVIVTNSDATRTLPVGLQYFAEQYGTRIDLQMAGSTLAALPVVFAFLVLQRLFIEGIAATGVKG